MKKFAVIVAAGMGSRMGRDVPKQFIDLLGKPLFLHTVAAFIDAYPDISIILVTHPLYAEKAQGAIDAAGFGNRVRIVHGGDTRFASVRNGLAAVPGGALVLVHDAARCMVTATLIRRCVEEALRSGSAVPVIPMTDSVRIVTSEGSRVLDRSILRTVQTPQAFLANQLKDAYESAGDGAFTDDASVFEHAGGTLSLVEGEPSNIKVTHPYDLVLVEALKKNSSQP